TVYAQPLYWDGGEGGQDLLLIATQNNEVIALDPLTGSRIWSRTLAAPASRSELPCGNIDPLGITGTPVIDAGRRLVFVAAMTSGARHRIFTLSLPDGGTSETAIGLSTWDGGEAILKLAPGPSYSANAADYYAPSDWADLDSNDADIGTGGAVPFDVASGHYVATLGKDGRLHLADRDSLDGI